MSGSARKGSGKRLVRVLVLGLVSAVGLACAQTHVDARRAKPSLASRIEQLSEPGGFFDTDNLISNERSYLHVMQGLEERGVSGGAYIGVGPDQNFSYVAKVRPSIAFMVDIRRDNMLLHLLFKALFADARNRVEYLCLLFGRQRPVPDSAWSAAGIERLVQYVDSLPADSVAFSLSRNRLDGIISSFELRLTPEDSATIDRFHRTFAAAGLSLQFASTGRAPQSYYPTYRDLMLETDRAGRRSHYLAREIDFQFLKRLQAADLVIPVTGDLAGPRAMRAIGELVERRGETVSAFYTSNVEYYLFSGGSFARFADNVAGLPHDDRSVIIRSVFRSAARMSLAESMPGYASTQLLQPVGEFLAGYKAGAYPNYIELVRRETAASMDSAPRR